MKAPSCVLSPQFLHGSALQRGLGSPQIPPPPSSFPAVNPGDVQSITQGGAYLQSAHHLFMLLPKATSPALLPFQGRAPALLLQPNPPSLPHYNSWRTVEVLPLDLTCTDIFQWGFPSLPTEENISKVKQINYQHPYKLCPFSSTVSSMCETIIACFLYDSPALQLLQKLLKPRALPTPFLLLQTAAENLHGLQFPQVPPFV